MPKAQPPENPPLPWATWIADRLPQFKVHASLRPAKLAIGMQVGPTEVLADGITVAYRIRGGVLYSMEEGGWVVSAVIEPGSFKHEHLLFTAPRKWRKAPGITTVISEHPFAA
jgi:hypothetical protein